MTNRREYYAEYYRKHKARPPAWRACLLCGTQVIGTRRRKYCSARCRVKAARQERRT